MYWIKCENVYFDLTKASDVTITPKGFVVMIPVGRVCAGEATTEDSDVLVARARIIRWLEKESS